MDLGSRTILPPPLRLSLLVVAWQCSGELKTAAEVSAKALPHASKLGSPAAACLFWLRRGHLLTSLHSPAEALKAYAARSRLSYDLGEVYL